MAAATLTKYTAVERELIDTFSVFYDMANDQVDTELVDTITDSGTVLMGDAACGTAVLTPSDGSVGDNDEAYLTAPNENFLFASGCNLYGRCRLKFVETTATIYNVAFFFMNAAVANSIVDDGGGLKVSGSTVGIYKIDGSGVWKCVTANNGTSTVSTSLSTAVTATYYVLEIFAEDISGGTQIEFTFKVDGVYLTDSTTNQIIRHRVTVASATEMMVGVGAKLGAATNNDTTTVDYIFAKQVRV